ncbi:alanine racemase [Luteimonas wenzhouensis]|uniref:Alanine racemase n=1 Tax=Luteimonas wenzhouensis TaxID=2599615 RepID=A0A5C5U250_9GAMM|nr:alanine racemase [Luteimonas wenzhouensis]TWT19622.1 alanine racemase [Luteimonas wenzhouensis]
MRPSRATIDLDALRHNYRLARRLGGGRALAVVKADAYGHGAIACARALEADADGFGVACMEEALELREAGIEAPIVLLEGFFDADELDLVERHHLWTVVASPWQVDLLERHRARQPWQVWLKLDSGMHRLGLSPEEFVPAWQRLSALPWIERMVAMTHFSRADELSHPSTPGQMAVFESVLASLPPGTPASVANSAALMAWPATRREWVRPGLMLYGAHMLDAPCAAADELRAVMTLESKVIAVRDLAAGEPIGYAGTYTTTRPTRVGVVAAGYADGYPQYATSGTPVVIDGRPGELIGRVSMDMLTIDLTDHPEAGLGSRVELWGPNLPVAEVAARSGNSPYRLLAGLKRVPRRYA